MNTTETQKSTARPGQMHSRGRAGETQRRAPLVPVAVACIAGVLMGARLPCPLPLLLAIGAFSGVVAWSGRAGTAGAACRPCAWLWACLGAVRMAAWSAHPDNRLAAFLPEEPRSVRLPAVVVTDPVGVFDPGEPGRAVCVLRLRHVRDATGTWRPLAGRVRAMLVGSDPTREVAYGDEVLVEGEYDWRAALARERIHGMLRVRPFDGLVVLAHGRGAPVLAAVFSLRRRWERLIDATFSVRDAGLLRSLLLGERGPLDARLTRAFVDTGTVHVLASECTKLP